MAVVLSHNSKWIFEIKSKERREWMWSSQSCKMRQRCDGMHTCTKERRDCGGKQREQMERELHELFHTLEGLFCLFAFCPLTFAVLQTNKKKSLSVSMWLASEWTQRAENHGEQGVTVDCNNCVTRSYAAEMANEPWPTKTCGIENLTSYNSQKWRSWWVKTLFAIPI